ncbi:MAG: hypothetical protein J7K61_01260 [Thermoplasmata archaeon]|nr:hypothetical protein [Thermoplasmata archaeon]
MLHPKFGRKARLETSSPFWEAVLVITGTVIGAGILGLPAVFEKSGYLTASLALIISFIIAIEIAYMIIELEGNTGRQIPGIIEYHLGSMAKAVAILAFFIAIFSAMTAYYTGLANSFASLNLTSGLGYIVGVVITLYVCIRGLHASAKAELIITLIMLVMIGGIMLWLIPSANFSKLNKFNPSMLAYPFGVIIFAVYGHMVLPEVKRLLISHNLNRKIGLAIFLGFLIPSMLYLLFSASVVGSFENIPDVSTIAFTGAIYVMGMIFALLALSTSLIGNALALRDALQKDFGFKKEAMLISPIIPLMMAVLGGKNFIFMLDVGGIFGISLLNIIISIAYLKNGKKIYRKVSAIAAIIIFSYLILNKIYTISINL